MYNTGSVFSDPKKVIGELTIQPGFEVADLGAGSGHYAQALARAVGDKGKVYAVDVQKELLDRIKNEARREKIHNIEVLRGDIEVLGGTHLADASVQIAVAANVLFQCADKAGLAREAFRILKPNGRMLVVDWKDSYGGTGPIAGHVVTASVALPIFESAGFTKERDITAGEHHWGIILKKV